MHGGAVYNDKIPHKSYLREVTFNIFCENKLLNILLQ